MSRRDDKPLWQQIEFALVWFVVLAGCASIWFWLINEVAK